jgi:hypothetical protein
MSPAFLVFVKIESTSASNAKTGIEKNFKHAPPGHLRPFTDCVATAAIEGKLPVRRRTGVYHRVLDNSAIVVVRWFFAVCDLRACGAGYRLCRTGVWLLGSVA